MLEVPLYGQTVSDVIEDLLDVSLSIAEDCLHLAVSTPDINPEKPLPVMAFIYGGGFKVLYSTMKHDIANSDEKLDTLRRI